MIFIVLSKVRDSAYSFGQMTTPTDSMDEQLETTQTQPKKAPPRRKERWKNLQSHLDQALSQWNEISSLTEGELSPDQKQLQEVKGLLQQLKTKLEQF